MRQCKAIVQGMLDNCGGFFESLLAILFVHSRMVQAGVIAALNHHGDKRFQLAPSVAREVDMRF
jgi:hypothetical protein